MDLDLHILPLHRHEGQDLSDLPGLFVADASITRRASRSRKGDILVLHLALNGTATLTAEDQAQVLEAHAQAFFESSGSVTAALRTVGENLNEFLLDRNREGASRNLQATGSFTGIVFHNGQIYTAQSGPNHVFTVHAVTAQDLHDPYLAGRGLGVSRSLNIHLNHAPLDSGDLIILSTNPPMAWKAESLQKAYGRPLGTIHRVLMNAAGSDLRAVLIQVHEGKGAFKILKRDELGSQPPPAAAPAPGRAAPATRGSEPPQVPVKAAAEGREPVPGGHTPIDSSATSSLSTPIQSSKTVEPALPPRRRRNREGGQAVLAVIRAFGGAMRTFGYSLRALLTRVLPGSELFTIPPSTMAFIAVAVPILLVTVAGVVYVQRGRQGQYNRAFEKAQEVAEFAGTRTDPNEIRISWQAVLGYLDEAERFETTEESQALRIQAYASLDPLEGIERLDFQPVLLTALGENVNIIRMVATRDELYLLDEISGSVIRAWLSGRGYEIDTEFKCGSFGNTTYSIGKLIDIAALPQNNVLGADIFAMDSNGNALYCKSDGSPPVAQAVAPPASNWGDPRSFVLDSGQLYVLDPQTNAVWIYSGEQFSFINPPRLFFDEEVPEMENVIDFAVDLDDLYLLHADGHITTCTFGFAGQSTKCTDPSLYTDTRPGKENTTLVPGTQFTQLRFSPPPDPSIYLLDEVAGAVYHYSLRLTFQRQYRPLAALEGTITAFAISPGRTIFTAFGNEIYGSILP